MRRLINWYRDLIWDTWGLLPFGAALIFFAQWMPKLHLESRMPIRAVSVLLGLIIFLAGGHGYKIGTWGIHTTCFGIPFRSIPYSCITEFGVVRHNKKTNGTYFFFSLCSIEPSRSWMAKRKMNLTAYRQSHPGGTLMLPYSIEREVLFRKYLRAPDYFFPFGENETAQPKPAATQDAAPADMYFRPGFYFLSAFLGLGLLILIAVILNSAEAPDLFSLPLAALLIPVCVLFPLQIRNHRIRVQTDETFEYRSIFGKNSLFRFNQIEKMRFIGGDLLLTANGKRVTVSFQDVVSTRLILLLEKEFQRLRTQAFPINHEDKE
ncbi:MAG: hypothetical protein IJ357_08400 [Oscillospiraceae bacterium]|nr:hypothetical protein [Oscillospiraceae bacterium]